MIWQSRRFWQFSSPDLPLPPNFFQPVAPVNASPHTDNGKQKSQAHVAPELARRPLPWHKNVVHGGRRWQREVRKIGGGKEPVPRHRRHEERGEGPFRCYKNRQKGYAAKDSVLPLGSVF